MSVPLTLSGTMVGMVTNGTMDGVLINGMMTDGTNVGNKRTTLPQAHFHIEVWMSVPPVVRSCFEWVKMNLDTGAAVNRFPLNFGPGGGGGDGRFYRTASGDWIPDCGASQFQGNDENGLLRSLNGETHLCTQSFVQCCRNRVHRTTRFLPRTSRWIHDSYSQQNWSGDENSFWEVGELAWKE